MTTSPDNDLEFFENLDDLVIDEAKNQATAPEDRIKEQHDRSKRSVPTLSPAPAKLHDGPNTDVRVGRRASRSSDNRASQKTSRLSEDDVVDLLQSSTSHPSLQVKATNDSDVEASAMPSPRLVASVAVPIPALKAERPSLSSMLVSRLPWRWLVGFLTVGIFGGALWYLSSHMATHSPHPFQGTIRFEGTVPPAVFIQLFKLNSPREEDYVTEIRDGQFVFPDVSSGDYALWLATVDGTPIPVRPVGASLGVLTETEHHLRISLNGKSEPLVLELSAVRRAK